MIDDAQRQITLANEVIKNGISVRQLEDKIRRADDTTDTGTRKRSIRHGKPEWRAAEEQLVRKWGRQVRIVGKNTGRIEIYFHGMDDLNRLVRTLLG
jgi:ParB-like chromosome segregation protein Spo0J